MYVCSYIYYIAVSEAGEVKVVVGVVAPSLVLVTAPAAARSCRLILVHI